MKIIYVYRGRRKEYRSDPRSYEHYWTSTWIAFIFSSFLQPQCAYVIFLYSQSCIHHLEGLFVINIMTSSQLFFSSVGRALHRYHRGHGFQSRIGLNISEAWCSLLISIHNCEDRFALERIFFNWKEYVGNLKDYYVSCFSLHFTPALAASCELY